MSVSVGPQLPEAALRLLGGGDAGERVGRIVVLLTVDAGGFPRVALLSPGEVVAISPSHVRLALHAGGTTLRNVADRGRVTLALLEQETCCYAMGRATVSDVTFPPQPLLPMPTRRVDVDVEDVLLDAEAGASIVTGPRYERDAPVEEELAHWARIHDGLRAA